MSDGYGSHNPIVTIETITAMISIRASENCSHAPAPLNAGRGGAGHSQGSPYPLPKSLPDGCGRVRLQLKDVPETESERRDRVITVVDELMRQPPSA